MFTKYGLTSNSSGGLWYLAYFNYNRETFLSIILFMMKRKVWMFVFSKLYSYFETGSVYMSSELPLTIVATKIQTFPKNILANMVKPFWPPQKLREFTAVIMVWLNLPAKIRTELYFTGQNSRAILAKNFLGDLQILRWPVWSDQSGHCKIHLNWQLTHLLATGNLLTCCCRFLSSLSCNKQYNIIISLLFNIYVI